MQITIVSSSERPVYQQIIDQIKQEIASGRLLPGEQLPTIRQLAVQLVINPNTIAKAYKYLEQEGLINTRPGGGSFVSEISSRLSDSAKKEIVCQFLKQAAVESVLLKVAPELLKEWFEETLKNYNIDTQRR
ncbi:MAG TPA: GntR family transcriptional regulator [Anaerohalosphaeraceae bacterium]|mgnify:CR=1 FL=1|nr:GntR family transcriptional regulator [Anaerohalosphaeraceae bacterium]HOL89205.1 GntR family transcriptional regulator [Anaerohalosphaeraceae bacterium]HPP56291.1 GntR family transcriptional regulator [Anaerohalosphaeraceae bacterium]